MSQLSLELPVVELPVACKERGCVGPVVGSSITGKGHVCKGHNEIEWGNALLRSEWQDYRAMGARLVDDGSRR